MLKFDGMAKNEENTIFKQMRQLILNLDLTIIKTGKNMASNNQNRYFIKSTEDFEMKNKLPKIVQ